jgi:hypothetical protein
MLPSQRELFSLAEQPRGIDLRAMAQISLRIHVANEWKSNR